MFELTLAVIVRTLADISLKKAVHELDFDSLGTLAFNLKKLICHPLLWIGGILGVGNMFIWSYSLKTCDLSYAYPFLSISYITIILSGKFFFNEHLDRYKLWGIAAICGGAVLLFVG